MAFELKVLWKLKPQQLLVCTSSLKGDPDKPWVAQLRESAGVQGFHGYHILAPLLTYHPPLVFLPCLFQGSISCRSGRTASGACKASTAQGSVEQNALMGALSSVFIVAVVQSVSHV